ncbi:hypothetical protein M233_07700 [Xylella fastidiosa subsp. multiplex Griffin-1]|nr:hypothetical protein M233_07700 [Xylella fastidiosa subsp. multiplex Griffin-1]
MVVPGVLDVQGHAMWKQTLSVQFVGAKMCGAHGAGWF